MIKCGVLLRCELVANFTIISSLFIYTTDIFIIPRLIEKKVITITRSDFEHTIILPSFLFLIPLYIPIQKYINEMQTTFLTDSLNIKGAGDETKALTESCTY